MSREQEAGFKRQWGWPIILAGLTLFGLLSALLGEGGIWWWMSWIALSVPLLVIARHWPLSRFFRDRRVS